MNSACYIANIIMRYIDFTYNTPRGRNAHTSLFRNFVGTFLSKRYQSLQIEQLESHFVSRSSYKSIRRHLKCCCLQARFMAVHLFTVH